MDILWGYFLVFILSAVPLFEAYGVIPIAVLTGLSPVLSFIIGVIGNVLTVLLLIVFINKVKEWRKKRIEKKETENNSDLESKLENKEEDVEKGEEKNDEEIEPNKRSTRAKKLWGKYGLPGLAMIGPLVVGSHITAFMGVTLGGSKAKTFYWTAASISIWSIVFTLLIYFGIDFLNLQDRDFTNYFTQQ